MQTNPQSALSDGVDPLLEDDGQEEAALHTGTVQVASSPAHADGWPEHDEEEPVPDPRPRNLRVLLPAAIGGVAVLAAVLIPLFLISPYNHSYADDWHYGVWAHLALQSTGGNIFAALGAALKEVYDTFLGWQGTYSAIFLMSLEPSVFGENLYWVTAPLILGSLVAGTFYFCHVLLVRWMRADWGTWICASCVVLSVQILLQPSPVEGIFWFNSAIYYTFFHALMLVLWGKIIMLCAMPTEPRHASMRSVTAALLALFVAGGNFVTVLVTFEVLTVLIILLGLVRRDRALRIFPAWILLTAGMVVSMIAPGNAERQATQFANDGLGVVDTIVQSSLAGFKYLGEWSSALLIVATLVLVVLLARVAAARATPSRLRFSWPAVVSAGSIALFASSFTATYFSMGTQGPGRVQNCRFDLLVILVLFNVMWWCGWAARRRVESEGHRIGFTLSDPQAMRLLALLGIVAVCLVLPAVSDDKIRESMSSLSAAHSVATGQAAAYDQQVKDRLEAIESTDSKTLVVNYYTDAPKVLFMGDIRDNMDNYINYRLCQWYGKDSIVAGRPDAGDGTAGTAAVTSPTSASS